MLLQNFSHSQQRSSSDCLAACAEMALRHLGISVPYSRIERLLRATPDYTPFGNLRYLESLGLFIKIETNGTAAIFQQMIELGLPVIVAVQTAELPQWQYEATHHALVVVGINLPQETITIHDPRFVEAPIEIPLLNFMIGWEEKDRQYAFIALADPN